MDTGDKVVLGVMWIGSLIITALLLFAATNGYWRQDAVDHGHAEWTINQSGEKGWQWLERSE